MKIVADDKIPFLKGVLEPHAEMLYLPGPQIRRDHLMDADALITRTRTRVGRDLLEGTRVRFVATATIGYDHLDTAWLEANGIRWTNAPGCNSGSVMQYLAAALSWLAVNRKIRFNKTTLGIIGVGHVGSKVARMAATLGMQVLLNDPPRQRAGGESAFVALPELLAQADIVTLHVPLNKTGEDRTLGLVDEFFMSRLKPGAILINTSRGPVVCDAVLKEAVKSGHLGGLVLDVWNHEPAIDRDLLKAADISTPHIAGYSADGKANGTAMSVQAVARFFGLPLTEWFPTEIPPPENPVIDLTTTSTEKQEALIQSVLHTYPIDRDDRNLRENPEQFEQLRGNYPVRREFFNYTVVLNKKNIHLIDTLKKFGFNVTQKTS